MTTTPEVHTQVTGEELAHVFDEAPPPADLSVYGVEDWFTLATFWLMVGCVVLQFFTRYVLNNSYAWTEEIAIYALVVVVFLAHRSLCAPPGTSRSTSSTAISRRRRDVCCPPSSMS